MVLSRKHQKVEKQDSDRLPHHNDASHDIVMKRQSIVVLLELGHSSAFGKCFYIYSGDKLFVL